MGGEEKLRSITCKKVKINKFCRTEVKKSGKNWEEQCRNHMNKTEQHKNVDRFKENRKKKQEKKGKTGKGNRVDHNKRRRPIQI
jgi:hypothetical protein